MWHTARLAASNEPPGTDHTGEIISFFDVGSGADGQPRPWYCYTSDPGGAVWQFPNGDSVRIDLVKGVATGDELFISGVNNPGAVVLHRGPTHFSPDGEHCCVRTITNERRCVTFSEWNIFSFSMYSKCHMYNYTPARLYCGHPI